MGWLTAGTGRTRRSALTPVSCGGGPACPPRLRREYLIDALAGCPVRRSRGRRGRVAREGAAREDHLDEAGHVSAALEGAIAQCDVGSEGIIVQVARSIHHYVVVEAGAGPEGEEREQQAGCVEVRHDPAQVAPPEVERTALVRRLDRVALVEHERPAGARVE